MRWCVVHDAQAVESEDAPGDSEALDAISRMGMFCWRALWREDDSLSQECELVVVYEEPQSEMDRIPIEQPVPEGWYEIVETEKFRMVAKPAGYRRILPDPRELV